MKKILAAIMLVFSLSSVALAFPAQDRERQTPESYADYKSGKKAESDFWKMAIPVSIGFFWYMSKQK